jgi:hypothetical protein
MNEGRGSTTRRKHMNEVGRAFEEAVNSSHRGTRIAFWVVMASVSYFFIRLFF